MRQEHEEHLGYILEQALVRIDEKYRKGQAEHGGLLSDVPTLDLIEFAIEEAVDQMVYLLTLHQQLTTTNGLSKTDTQNKSNRK